MTSLLHNRNINKHIRIKHEIFNTNWIETYGFIDKLNIAKFNYKINHNLMDDENAFMVVWLQNIDRLCEMLCNNYAFDEFTLLDVGCGVGISTLYFNQKYSFKNFLGFDYDQSLVKVARQNRLIANKNCFDTSNLDFEIADAKEINLVDKRYAIFMFNPFGWKTMNIFINNNLKILRQTKSILLYANDICNQELIKYGTIIERNEFYNLSLIAFR